MPAAVEHHAEIEFLGRCRPPLAPAPWTPSAPGSPGLLGDQRVLEHDLGDRLATSSCLVDVLDAAEVGAAVLEATLAAAAGVNLGLEDDGLAAESVEGGDRLGRRRGDDAVGIGAPAAASSSLAWYSWIFMLLRPGWMF